MMFGCTGAVWDKTEVPPPRVAQAEAARWEQFCTFNGANDLAEINRYLHDMGTAGWELVSIGGQQATVYCFKTRVEGAKAMAQAER